ncbi:MULTISPECIES: DUF58 domain-containing protein [unclassified Pseudofrankia]|uniref:DUF58 domain-containing protein n=1 Tax=unclassified Pseudofrankia TaxID=2994372 RepID=UPI0008D97453|nr:MULTISPECIES: DUF58 domain-containing protein [unclassified Pseudofrankia]MDT3442476.1 DUF58 domain-containing protein [Pseudofrankia sp. BMG5.37]OHV74730.1 hypothetical protein BCD48_31815 [Pseudofrankia sp. BMG5.36]
MITRSGLLVAALAVALGVAGFVLRYPEFVVMSAAATLALVVACAWLFVAPDVVISREIRPAGVVEGEPASGVLTVTNVSGRRCPPLRAAERVAGTSIGIALPSLAAGAGTQRGYAIPTGRRGVFEVGPLVVGHSDPLRLIQLSRELPGRSTLRVRPRVLAVAPLPTGGSFELDGPAAREAPLGGVAFHSMREYVRGDDRRLIHWRSSARAAKLMVRQNVVPNEMTMMVVLDTSAAPYTDDFFEDAVRVASSLIAAGLTRGFPVELWTTGRGRLAAGRDIAAGEAMLDLLAEVTTRPDDPGLAALAAMMPGTPGVALGVVTGQPAPSALGAVSAVRPRYAMVSLVQVGELHGRPAPSVSGALAVNVRTSDEFAAVWGSRARR